MNSIPLFLKSEAHCTIIIIIIITIIIINIIINHHCLLVYKKHVIYTNPLVRGFAVFPLTSCLVSLVAPSTTRSPRPQAWPAPEVAA